MSHYTVAVVTKEKPTMKMLEEIMAPFDENISVEPYICTTKQQFLEEKRKDLERYKNGLYAEYCSDPDAYAERCKHNPSHLEYIKNFLNVYNMTDEELLAERRNGNYSKEEALKIEKEEGYLPSYIDENDNEWSTYNPLSKWDWYSVGGRWGGLLNLKNGQTADSARIGDINFGNDINVEELIPKYQSEYDKLTTEGEMLYNAKYYQLRYPDIEHYIRSREAFGTYAILMPDGKWHEKGRCLWWGQTTATPEDEKLWDENFYDSFLKNLEEDWYMTIIDCHI